MEVKVNINDYLTEQEKKEIAIETFKEHVRKELFKESTGTIKSDSEVQRVIGNITHQVVFNEVEKYIPDARNLIKEGVKKVIKKDLSHTVFKKKDDWGSPDSLAIKYLNEEIKENEGTFKARIKECITNYDFSSTVNEEISNQLDKLAGSLYSLSELFQKNK